MQRPGTPHFNFFLENSYTANLRVENLSCNILATSEISVATQLTCREIVRLIRKTFFN
jgi:hypothetical protein